MKNIGEKLIPLSDSASIVDATNVSDDTFVAPEGEQINATGGNTIKSFISQHDINTFFANKKDLYVPAVSDSLTTPYNVGAIKANVTKASDLKLKTFSELFDYILFPEVEPTIVQPSLSISLKNYSIYQFVGSVGPLESNININANPGSWTNNGGVSPQPYQYAGTATDYRYSLTTPIAYGKNTCNVIVKFPVNTGVNSTPKTNKGSVRDKWAEADKSASLTINGVYKRAFLAVADNTDATIKLAFDNFSQTPAALNTNEIARVYGTNSNVYYVLLIAESERVNRSIKVYDSNTFLQGGYIAGNITINGVSYYKFISPSASSNPTNFYLYAKF